MGWLMLVPFSVAVSNAVFTMREDSTTWDATSARRPPQMGSLFDHVSHFSLHFRFRE
jgi:hypothetical protein